MPFQWWEPSSSISRKPLCSAAQRHFGSSLFGRSTSHRLVCGHGLADAGFSIDHAT